MPFEIVCRSPIEPIFSRFYATNGISNPFDGVVPEAHGAGLERDYFFVVANDVLVGVWEGTTETLHVNLRVFGFCFDVFGVLETFFNEFILVLVWV